MGRWMAAALAGCAVAAPAAADTRTGTLAWNKGDWKTAVDEWRGPALAGDADAQFNLGQAYKLGRGVPVDLDQAIVWYMKAAAKNHPRAIDDLGLVLFTQGRRADALPWLEKSAARDERRAEYVLGTMLFNGDTVPRDWVRAYGLISRSSQQGLAQAGSVLAQLDGYVTPEQREKGTALAARIAADAQATRANLAFPPAALAGTEGGPRPIETTALPPSTAAAPSAPPASTAMAAPPPKPRPSPKTASTPKPSSPPKPVASASGRYRIQLGAFRDEGNAHALWAKVGGRTGGRPSYLKAGGITRLQAGPFASEADARRACRASGVACDVVAAK